MGVPKKITGAPLIARMSYWENSGRGWGISPSPTNALICFYGGQLFWNFGENDETNMKKHWDILYGQSWQIKIGMPAPEQSKHQKP